MKLLMCNDHPVVRLGGEHYIVDTGSPVSFHYAGPQALEVAGRGYLLCARPFCDKETADALTGIDVGGFVGMDILQKSGLTVDLENSELEFAAVPGPDPAGGEGGHSEIFIFGFAVEKINVVFFHADSFR